MKTIYTVFNTASQRCGFVTNPDLNFHLPINAVPDTGAAVVLRERRWDTPRVERWADRPGWLSVATNESLDDALRALVAS